jgi:hypothetical protein
MDGDAAWPSVDGSRNPALFVIRIHVARSDPIGAQIFKISDFAAISVLLFAPVFRMA